MHYQHKINSSTKNDKNYDYNCIFLYFFGDNSLSIF
jgi:hypothetical protein